MVTAAKVAREERHSKARPCPVCGGSDRDPRGKGRRCHGFTLDGWVHCSREEHAGGIVAGDKSGTYAHRLDGPCKCGTTHGTSESAWRDVEAAYDYRDERGQLLFQVVRLGGKNFRQRKPDGIGGWDWSTAGIRRVLYRLPDVLAADPSRTVYIVEGEKDVENLRSRGEVATCNPMGAGKWHHLAEHAREALKGRRVIILPDDDDAGRKHASEVAASLTDCTVRVVPLYPQGETKRDVSDWLAEGHTLDELDAPTENEPSKPRPPFISVGDAIEELQKLSKLPVIATPYPTLNEALGFGGLLGGQVYDVVAGTGRGKTTWCSQIAREVGTTRDVVVAFFEAFGGYVVARMAAGPLGVHSSEIIRNIGQHDRDVFRALPDRVRLLNRPDLAGIGYAVDYLADKNGVAPLVIVDYIGKLADKIQASQHRPDARLATSEASAGLLEIADRTKAPILAVSAMSRMNNRRARDVRKLSPYELVDVAKESGAVEYDSAGLIVLSLSDDYEGSERVATMTVAKARFGTECHVDMRYDGARGIWRDLGRIEGERPSKVEPDLRSQIRAALPAASGTKLAVRIGRNKADVLAMIKTMIAEGEVDASDGLQLAEVAE